MVGAFVSSHVQPVGSLSTASATTSRFPQSSFLTSTRPRLRPILHPIYKHATLRRRRATSPHSLSATASAPANGHGSGGGNGTPEPSSTPVLNAPSNTKEGTPIRDIVQGVYQLALPLWTGERKLVANLWTAATVFLALMATAYAVLLSMVQRFFWNCLAAKDVSKFSRLLTLYLIVVTVGPIIVSLFTWVKERLSLMWRNALTNHLLTGYFTSLNYYKLSLGATDVDNPDQRISEDVINFTSRSVRFITIIAVAIFDLLVFSVILHGIYAPLLYTLFFYSAIGTAAIAMTGRNLLSLVRQRTQREGNFRFGLVRVRESTESIAFYGGEAPEKSELQTRFSSVFRNQIIFLALQRNVEFLSTAFRYFAQIVPTMVIAPKYFAGTVQLGVLSQVYFSFNHVLSSLGLVVQEFRALSEFGAGTRRLKQLADVLAGDAAASAKREFSISSHVLDGEGSDRLAVRNLSVMTPNEPARTLVQGLDLDVASGEHLLVTGQSGLGKSSLMRAICGLWDSGEGVVERPASQHTLFLPQKPFIMLGTLRDNVVYPSSGTNVSDDDVMNALQRVNLGYLPQAVGGLNAPGEALSRRLSLGEQQRLAFARLVIARPKLIVLDESSSALDLENERDMYALVKNLGMTCISVGNRPSLVDFHDRVLRLDGEGAWTILTPEAVKSQRSESSV